MSDIKRLTLKEKIKNMRVEYKVLVFFISVFLFYIIYDFIQKNFLSDFQNANKATPYSSASGGASNTKSSINEAISSDRPIVLSITEIKSELNKVATEDLNVESMEIATEASNPVIWIYIVSDGTRKDDLAEYYCNFLKGRGVQAKSITILDEKAKQKGKIVELGEKKCM